jgi:hypothetical protein
MAIYPFAGMAGRPSTLFENKSVNTLQCVRSWLLTQSGGMADGNAVVFGIQYSNAVDGWDAMKMTNPGENFGLLRQGFTLAVEARQPVYSDTMFFKLTNLAIHNYQIKIVHEGMQGINNVTCELVDKYLNTRTIVSFTDTTNLSFPVNSDPASKAQDRLMLVYKPVVGVVVLPIVFSSFDVLNINDKQAQLKWAVDNELDVDQYLVETSENGGHFYTVGTVAPVNNHMGAAKYSFQHQLLMGTDHYYRISAIDKNGAQQQTRIMRLRANAVAPSLSVYPNPVVDHRMQVAWTGAPNSSLVLQLVDAFGKTVMQQPFSATVGVRQTISINRNIPAGVYHLRAIAADGSSSSEKIMIL